MNIGLTNQSKQSGSVIVWILIAIGLIAALSFAFTSSSRNSTALITDAQAKAYASQIISNFNEHKQSIKRLLIRGCDVSEVSYEGGGGGIYGGYGNTNSPDDYSCHVYEINGAGLKYPRPPVAALDKKYIGGINYKNYWHSRNFTLRGGIGQWNNYMLAPYLSDSVCKAINKIKYGVSDIPVYGGSPSIGSYRGGWTSGGEMSCPGSFHGSNQCTDGPIGCFQVADFLSEPDVNIGFALMMRNPP